MITLAIDPGANGGIAVHDGETVSTWKMPETPAEVHELLMKIFLDGVGEPLCYIEQVGQHVHGNSASASVKFARHCGHLEGILIAMGIPTVLVPPQKWMKNYTLPHGSGPAAKAARKRAVKVMMQARFPHLRVTDATADALAILTWAADGAKNERYGTATAKTGQGQGSGMGRTTSRLKIDSTKGAK